MAEEVYGTDYPALRKHLAAYGQNNLSQDPRFINTNNMRKCWINYADFYRCTYVREYLGKDTEGNVTFFKDEIFLSGANLVSRTPPRRLEISTQTLLEDIAQG